MDKVKQWVAAAVVAALALLAGGWTLLVAPTRSEASGLQEQVVAQEGTNAQLATSLEVLRGKADRLPDEQAELARVARRIPADSSLPDLLRALATAAAEAGVELSSITPSAPAPVDAAAAPAPVPPVPADPAAPADATVPAAPAPAAGTPPGGLSAIPLSMAVAGEFYAVEQFLALLEELPRALRITGLSMDPAADALSGDATATNARLTVRATLTGQVYLSSSGAATTAQPPVQPGPPAGTTAPAAPAAPAVTATSNEELG